MVKTSNKRGRKAKAYVTTWGETIPGLARRPSDGRWRIIEDNFTFTEADERLAISRYRKVMEGRKGNNSVMLPVGQANVHDVAPLLTKARKLKVTFRVPRDPTKPVTVESSLDTDEIWAYVRDQIISRPKWVAERIGIEQIAYLGDISKPAPSRTLKECGDYYASKTDITGEETTRTKRFWKEFTDAVQVETLRELKQEHIEAYETAVAGMKLSAKSVKHRYSGVRTIIAWSLKKNKGKDDCRRVLDLMTSLEAATPDSLDPDPIKPVDFWAIHAAAVNAGDKVFAAMMLASLNLSLYPSEAGAVKWDDIDMERGEFSTRRRKTKIPRVGILWPETLAALKDLPNDRPTVFNTSRQAYARFSVFRDWDKYRILANRKTIKFAQIRDASFTAACRASLDQARVLSGHRLPGSVDAYVLRQPGFVTAACEAIRAEFFKGR